MLCRNELIWNITPSLVEHIGYDKSLIGNGNDKNRLSKIYIGETDPNTINWYKGSVSPILADITWDKSIESLKSVLRHPENYAILDTIDQLFSDETATTVIQP
jgi:hypothetical protein